MGVWSGAGFRPVRRGRKKSVSHGTASHVKFRRCNWTVLCTSKGSLFRVFLSLVAKALQEFDLALRGKKKRKKFMQDTQRKVQMTVSIFTDKWDPRVNCPVFFLSKTSRYCKLAFYYLPARGEVTI